MAQATKSFPFVGGSHRARSSFMDAQRSVNLYPEMSKSGTAKSVAALYGTPGLAIWQTFAGGATRGGIRLNANLALICVGINVYTVTAAGVSTLVGVISAGTDPVGMAFNGTLVMIVAGLTGYFYNVNTGVFTQIVDPDFNGGDAVGFIDGYFAWNDPGTGKFQITQLYGDTIDALDFATAEGAPDNVLSLLIDHREIWLFGETTTEVFFNSGNINFPFERIQGAFIEIGCAAKYSPAKMDNTVYWLASDERGRGIVQRAQGYQPQRVSDHDLEYAIAQYSTISDAIGYTYQQEGHYFYVLNFPTANATWVFDAASGEWHERAWRDPVDGSLDRHRSQWQMNFANKTLVGDWENGNVYEMDLDLYSDFGGILPAIRQAPYLSAGSVWSFFAALWIDMEVGIGLVSGQGSDPTVMCEWSDDGGKTWKSQVSTSAGKIGEYTRRVMFRRLGKSKARVFRISITDPVKRAIIGAGVSATMGT